MLKSLGRRFAGTVLLFSGLVGVGTSVVLLLCSCLGYLAYSDRPGPGWWGRLHWPTLAECGNYLGFAPWFAYFCLFFGLGLFGLSLVLGASTTPRWFNRLLGGAISAATAGLAVMGAGWYFALAAIGPDAAVILGLLYGVFLFPLFIEPSPRPLATWARISAVLCTTVLFAYWIISPFLPHRPVAEINYDLMRVTQGAEVVTSTPFLGSEVSKELAALNMRGNAHGGIGGSVGSGQSAEVIDLQLIAFEPIAKEARLAIPKTGHVVYVLHNGVWTAHPAIAERDKRTLTVEPGLDPRFDGGRVKLGKDGAFQAFTWYPVIPKGQ